MLLNASLRQVENGAVSKSLKKFRSKNRDLHRKLGRFLLVCALISGLYGIISLIVLPVFGGLASDTAGWFFGTLFVVSIIRVLV